jgi:hypothetical protein
MLQRLLKTSKAPTLPQIIDEMIEIILQKIQVICPATTKKRHMQRTFNDLQKKKQSLRQPYKMYFEFVVLSNIS